MKKFFTGTALAVVAAVCIIGYAVFSFLNPEKGLDNLAPSDRLSLKKNIVVLGVDERAEEHDVGRSDTLFVVMFDTQTKNASLLSIPRDTRVRIPKHGWDKINHAYAYGGRELTQKTVEELLGLHINNYVMIDFKGFKGLVDAIGGVDINVEKDMYYRDSWDGFTIDIKKGMQHMDGETAIQYVRYRDEEGDIGRIRRQQHFMMAVYDRISSADMLLHIPGLAQQLNAMIKTDLPINDMLNLGKALHSMVREKGLSMAMVPGTPEYIDDISYWQPDITDLRELMVKMQGAEMTERYRSAAELMEREYNEAVERARQGDTSDESKPDDDKDTLEKKDGKDNDKAKLSEDESTDAKDEKKVSDDKKSSSDKKRAAAKAGAANISSNQKSGGSVVMLINCSGNKDAAQSAKARLQAAGFTVVNGGSGDVIAETKVISNTNNGAVISRLSNIPFSHKISVTRDGDKSYDGVVMLGKDYL